MEIKSFLPVFTGFYGTIFEPDEEVFIEDDHTYDDYNFFYKEYYEEMAKACVNAVENRLNTDLGFKIKIKYENVYSPREYNFTNDSIKCTFVLSKKTIKELYQYLNEHKEAFENFIKDGFTSYSGFYSFYSNDVNVWLNPKVLDFSDAVVCGSILDFILLNDDFDQHELYEKCCDVQICGELK